MYRIKYTICLAGIILLSVIIEISAQLKNASDHPKYKVPLPVPVQIDATKGGNFNVEMNQTTQWLGLVDVNGLPLNTTVWGYGLVGEGVTYPGPTFTASKDVPVYVNWYNNLPASGHLLPVDYSLHLAYPHNLMTPEEIQSWYNAGNIPAVAHLHGGHTESESDGLPEAWFTQGAAETGHHFVKTNYVYDNDQEAATLWYHDHALGITRLNVYAGLAGFYLLEDKNERKLTVKGVLPKGKHDMEIVIQDRNFTNSGQLILPFEPSEIGPMFGFEESEWMSWPSPTIAAEFFGSYILVNGAAWPFMEVEPRPYRLRLLNGSDSRFYVLELDNPKLDFLQIATDNGLLPQAVSLNRLVLGPGERAELVVDFSGKKDQTITLYNYGPDEPFKGFNEDGSLSNGDGGVLDPADPSSTGQIMQFKVTRKLKVNKGLPIPTVAEGTKLRSPLKNLGTSTTTRQLALFEGSDEYGRLQPLLGTLSDGSLTWEDEITENPGLNDVETWEVYNFTADAHPIHLHLVSFQIINREAITEFELEEKEQLQHSGLYGTGATVEEVELSGTPEAPADNEKGWKDTFIVPPGYAGRVKAKFDRPGRYVWHCHILSHEDHEMMRPYHVGPVTMPKSSEMIAGVTEFELSQNYPNPFNPETVISFSLPDDGQVSLKIFDILGNEIAVLINQDIPKGKHDIKFNASVLSSGIYFYTIKTADFSQTRKMILMK